MITKLNLTSAFKVSFPLALTFIFILFFSFSAKSQDLVPIQDLRPVLVNASQELNQEVLSIDPANTELMAEMQMKIKTIAVMLDRYDQFYVPGNPNAFTKSFVDASLIDNELSATSTVERKGTSIIGNFNQANMGNYVFRNPTSYELNSYLLNLLKI